MQLVLSTREMWRALPQVVTAPLELPIKHIFYSCTRTPSCRFKGDCRDKINMLQIRTLRVHKLDDIRFSFLVTGDGKAVECRGWRSIPHLPPKYRHLAKNSLYIGFLGSFTKFYCPDIMLDVDRAFLEFYINTGFISPKYLEINLNDEAYFFH